MSVQPAPTANFCLACAFICHIRSSIKLSLNVQASNLAGIDKVSLEDRYKWTSDNLSAILDSADDPFGMDGDGFGK